MQQLIAVARALSEPNRVRVIRALQGRELCVCQITELLELAPSTVSRHMSVLQQGGMVDSRKDGRWVYYRLAGEDAPIEAWEAIQWALRHACATPEAQRDSERLTEMLKIDPEELCRRRRGN